VHRAFSLLGQRVFTLYTLFIYLVLPGVSSVSDKI
jgi:hypothetical protein